VLPINLAILFGSRLLQAGESDRGFHHTDGATPRPGGSSLWGQPAAH
jgi:hypothetical protein